MYYTGSCTIIYCLQLFVGAGNVLLLPRSVPGISSPLLHRIHKRLDSRAPKYVEHASRMDTFAISAVVFRARACSTFEYSQDYFE